MCVPPHIKSNCSPYITLCKHNRLIIIWLNGNNDSYLRWDPTNFVNQLIYLFILTSTEIQQILSVNFSFQNIYLFIYWNNIH